MASCNLVFWITVALFPFVICSIKGPVDFIRNIGQNAVFKWNTTDSKTVLSVNWGLLGSNNRVETQLIYISIKNNVPVLSTNSNTVAVRYKGRVSWVGDLKAGRAWFKITNLTIQDTNQYAAAIREQGTDEAITHSTNLTVAELPSFSPSHPNKTYQIIEGRELSISCKANGTPTPEIRWVNVTDGSTKNQGRGTVVLHVNNIQRFQTGIYECQARNNPNEEWITKQTYVTVYYKPTILIEDFTRNISSWNGKEVTLKCVSEGLPTPGITWHMPNGQKRAAGVVTITTKNSSDYGRYKCEAKNVAGTDEHSIIVTQLFPPGPPNITISEEDIQASSVIVKWTSPGYDGSRSPVIAYKVQINSTKPPLEQNASKTEHKFTELKRNTRYEVRVYARNIVGYGIASIIIFTTKKKGPPPLPKLYLTESETLITMYWTKPDENGGVIMNYTIYQKQGDQQYEWKRIHVVTDLSNLTFKVRLLELEPGLTYWFIVTASNEFGESEIGVDKGKDVYIRAEVFSSSPAPTTSFVTGKDERKNAADETNPVVIAGAVGAVVLFLIAAVIAVIILRKKNVFVRGVTKSSRSERAAYHNEVDPDNIAHQGAAGRLSGIDDGIPTYAAVDVSKKKKNIPNYAAVDKCKKKRPREIVYAELADFNMSGAAAAATPRPITYTGTDYADISQFQKPDESEPTYANFPGRKNNFSNVQGM